MATMTSITMPSTLARGMTAARALRLAVPRSHAAAALGFGGVSAAAQHAGRGTLSPVVAASSSRGSGAVSKADPTPAQPAADQSLLKLGIIAAAALCVLRAGSASLPGVCMVAALAVLLLVVPWMWKAQEEWAAATMAIAFLCDEKRVVLELLHRHKPGGNRAAFMVTKHMQYLQLKMDLNLKVRILVWTAIAALALLAAAQLIRAASPSLPFLDWAARTVSFPVFGWSTDTLSLVTEWPAAVFLYCAFEDASRTALEMRHVRRLFFAVAARRREDNAARRGAACSAGQPLSMP